MPVGTSAEELITGILTSKPSKCSQEQKKQFEAFVEIGPASLNNQLGKTSEARQGFLSLTASDMAWSITNFKHYAGKDTPLEDQNDETERQTYKGNESSRKNKRQKIANKKVQGEMRADYILTKSTLEAWEEAMDVEDEEDRAEEKLERAAIRSAWADYWVESRRKVVVRENVAPSNGGANQVAKVCTVAQYSKCDQ